MSEGYPEVEVGSRAQWRDWLTANHDRAVGIWLVRFKRHVADRHVTYDEAVEEALCFGWVDSRPRRVDDDRSALLMTPRKATARWSAANKERVERLTAAGLMTRAGLASVETAKANGAWHALDSVERLEEPDDLAAALDAVPAARAAWDGFPPSARRGILEWILDARRAPTREKRIVETVSEAADGRRANQWPRR